MKTNDETVKKSIAKFEKIFAKGNMMGAVCFGNKFVSKNVPVMKKHYVMVFMVQAYNNLNLPEKSNKIKEEIKKLNIFKS
jgi:hypothetical protein